MFYIITINLSLQKIIFLKQNKRVLYKHYFRFLKIFKNSVHFNKFFVLLCDCLPNKNYFLSIDKLLENNSVRQLRTGNNSTNALYSENIKPEPFFDKKNRL